MPRHGRDSRQPKRLNRDLGWTGLTVSQTSGSAGVRSWAAVPGRGSAGGSGSGVVAIVASGVGGAGWMQVGPDDPGDDAEPADAEDLFGF